MNRGLRGKFSFDANSGPLSYVSRHFDGEVDFTFIQIGSGYTVR